jgi:hypothetical protein
LWLRYHKLPGKILEQRASEVAGASPGPVPFVSVIIGKLHGRRNSVRSRQPMEMLLTKLEIYPLLPKLYIVAPPAA